MRALDTHKTLEEISMSVVVYGGKFKKEKGYHKLEESDIPLIRGLLACGISVTDVAEKFEVGMTTIYRVKRGDVYSYVKGVAK
jgi:hypothetical protein